jgi:hypothetical protein
MREFAKGSFSLRQAPRPLRLIYAGFLLLVGVGIATELGFQIERIGLTPEQVAAYYRGGDDGAVMTFPKTFGQLLEVTHAHAFMMAAIFLILAHLFASTSTSNVLRGIVLSITLAGMVGNLAAPWLTRYGAAWCAWILLFAWAAQGAGSVLMVAVSAWECLAPS